MNILQLKTNLDRSKPVSIVEVANNYNDIVKPSRLKKQCLAVVVIGK